MGALEYLFCSKIAKLGGNSMWWLREVYLNVYKQPPRPPLSPRSGCESCVYVLCRTRVRCMRCAAEA